MKKSKSDVVILFCILVFSILVTCVVCFSNIEATTDRATTPFTYDSTNTMSGITKKADNIATTFAVIAQMIVVGAVVFMGLRYMFGAAEKKAELKKGLIYTFIGGVLIYGTISVITLVIDVTTDSNKYKAPVTSGGQTTTSTQTPAQTQTQTAYNDEYNAAVAAGLSPTGAGKDNNITRAQFAEVVYKLYNKLYDEKLLNQSLTTNNTSSFTDVNDADTDESKKAILALEGTDIIMGWERGGKTIFLPDSNISRQDIAVMLYRVVEKTGTVSNNFVASKIANYTDQGDISSYANKAVAYMVEKDVIKGTTSTTISPKSTASVQQAVVMAYRILNGIEKSE